jgi:phosphate transport system substrate-binding protein
VPGTGGRLVNHRAARADAVNGGKPDGSEHPARAELPRRRIGLATVRLGRRRAGLGALALALVLLVGACGGGPSGSDTTSGPARSGLELRGAGATFPEPIYAEWFAEFGRAQGVAVDYQPVGSGSGIERFLAGEVDFAATDAPLTDAEVAAAVRRGGPVLHVPTVLGAVVVIYNLPGVQKALKLDGTLLAALFQGRIRRWDDPAVARANPGVNLPALAVRTVHRSDGSGTTATFTRFLGQVSGDFKARVGSGKQVRWPGGLAGKGSDGVSALVQRTSGALGYVELTHALRNQLTFAKVANPAGRFVVPTIASTSAAAKDLRAVPADLRASLVGAREPTAYPIATWTFLVAFQRQTDAVRGAALARLLWYATHDAQAAATNLEYAPLPAEVLPRIERGLRSMTGPDGRPLLGAG